MNAGTAIDWTWVLSAAAYSLAMSATPGPNNAMVAASGATWGLRRTWWHIFGISVGFPAMIVCVALGAGGILERNPEITAKLDPAPESKLPRALDITKDDAVFKKIAEVYPRFQTVEPYMSGTAVLNGDKHYFVLMNQEGNSHIVLFTATRENPVGEPHSVHIAMACSRDSGRDMLFLGGDLARESAACYTRVVK